MRVVYVEDNIANVHLVKRVARMGKHEIINYIDGMDALSNFETDKPDLVLMDIQLAGELTGIEVVQKLREKGYKTPIFAVTAYAMVGDKERCMEAGCTGYMSKPIPIPDLVKLFSEYDTPTSELEQADAVVEQATPVAEKTSIADETASADSATKDELQANISSSHVGKTEVQQGTSNTEDTSKPLTVDTSTNQTQSDVDETKASRKPIGDNDALNKAEGDDKLASSDHDEKSPSLPQTPDGNAQAKMK